MSKYWRIITDVDGTLTRKSINQEILGAPWKPSEAVQPFAETTKKLVKLLFENYDVYVVSGNTSENLRPFFEFLKIPLDSSQLFAGYRGKEKIKIYQKLLDQFPEDCFFVFEDAETILYEIFLLDPKRIFPISAKSISIPEQFHLFLQTIKNPIWDVELFLDFVQPQYQKYLELQKYWLKISSFLKKTYLSPSIGPKFLSFKKGDKVVFRINISTFEVFLPSGKKPKGNLKENFDLINFYENEISMK